MDRAGRWLALRPRTEAELRKRLIEGGFEEDVVEQALVRLADLELVDDAAFARQLIEEKSGRRGLGPEALRAELEAKGIPADIAEEALGEAFGDEATRAREAALRFLPKVARFPLAEQGARLVQMLVRRGFSEEAAIEGARSVLPPEGWD